YAARVAAVRARLIALRDRVSAVPSTVSSIMELLGHHHHLSAARTDARGFGMQAILRTVRKGDPLQAYDIVNALGAIQINTGLIGESLETLIMALQAGKILSERRTEPSVPFATEQRVLEPEVADQAEPLEKALRGHLNKVTYLFGMVSDPKVPVDPETFNVALEDAQRRLAAVRDAIEGIAQAPESGALLRDTMKHLSTAFQSLEFYAKLGLENRKRFEKFVDRMSQPLAEAATIVAGLKELAHRARAGKPVPVAIWEMRDGKRFAHVDLKQLWGEAVAERVNRSASAMERIERVLSDLKELPGSSAPLRVAEVEERAYVDLRNWTAHPPTNALEERAKAFFYARAPHEDVAARVAEPAADQEGGQALGMVGWLAWAIPTLRRLWLPGPVIAAWGAVSELFFAGGINVLLSFVPWVAATLGFPDALGADSLALRLSLVLLSSFLYASPWKIGHPTLVTYRKGRVVTEEGTVGVVLRTILFALGVVFRLGYLRPDLLSPAGALGVALVLHAFHNAVVAPLLAFSAPWLRWPLGMAGETKAGPQAGPVDAVARMFQSLEKEPLHGTRFTERRYARNVTQDPDTGTWTVEFQIAPPGWMPSIVAKLSSSVSPTVGSVQFRYDPAWPALTIQQARIEQESQGDGLYSATVTRVMSALPPLTRLRFVIDERNTIETLYDALPRNVLQSMPDEFELFYLKDEQRIYPAARELAVPGIREADLHLVTTNDGHVWVEALSGWDRFWSEQPETGDDVRRALEGFVNTYQSELHMAPPREVIREIGDMLRAGIAQRVMGEEQEKERHEESDPFHVFLQTLKGVPPTDLNDIAFLRATLRSVLVAHNLMAALQAGQLPTLGDAPLIERVYSVRRLLADATRRGPDALKTARQTALGALGEAAREVASGVRPEMSDPEVSRLLNRFVDLPFSRVQAYWAASLVRGNGVSDLQVLRWYIGAQDRQHKSSRAMSRKPKNEVPRGEAIRNGRAVQSRAILDYFDEVLRQHPDVFRRDPRMGFRLLGLATRRIESPLHNVLFSLIGQSKLFEWDSPESLASMIAADVDALQRSLVDALKRSRPNAPPLNSQEDHLLAQMLLTTAYHMKKLQEGPSTGAQSPTEPSTGGAATLGLGGGGLGDFHGIKGGTLARGVVLGAALGTLAVLSAAQSMFFNEIKSAIPTNDQRVAEIIFGEALKDSDPTGAAQRLITRYRKLVEEFSRTRFTRVPPSGMTHKDVLVVQKAAPQAGEVESGLPGGLRGFVVAPWLVDWSSAPSWLSGDVVGVLVGLLLVAGVAGVAAVASVVDTQWLRAIFGRGSQPSAPVRVNVFERTLDAKHRMSISKARRHLAEVGRGVLKGSLTFKVIGEGRVAVLEDRPAASQGSTSETKETARHERSRGL
ncbi:MAG: hypothetical protein HYW10_02125, partial [Candidatus Omnitrophica bacterium]|nr:hypothetical protein [Candidatus Omnitrophota bacterium]